MIYTRCFLTGHQETEWNIIKSITITQGEHLPKVLANVVYIMHVDIYFNDKGCHSTIEWIWGNHTWLQQRLTWIGSSKILYSSVVFSFAEDIRIAPKGKRDHSCFSISADAGPILKSWPPIIPLSPLVLGLLCILLT